MAASRSTKNAIGWRIHDGANSARKMATPTASGVAISNATIDDTIVPYTAGAAPNFPLTASQPDSVKKLRPKVRSAGQPALNTTQAMRHSSTGTTSAIAVVV